MVYIEEKRDLFLVDSSYYLAHCISSDFALGAGIAKEFNKRFDVKKKLFDIVPWGSNEKYWDGNKYEKHHGYCIKTDRIFNLVTKRNHWHKPTLETLKNSLVSMRNLVLFYNIEKVAMPKIGCGLDKLNWNDVREIIKDVFNDTDVEILVCYL